MASRIQWHLVKPDTVRNELFELVLAVILLGAGWLSLPTLLLAVMAELVAVVAMTRRFHSSRPWRRHAGDVVKMLGLCLFLSVFVLASYTGAGGFDDGFGLSPAEWLGIPLLVLLRLATIARAAQRSGDPRLHWGRSALMRGGVLVVGFFLAAFACFIPGIFLAHGLGLAWPGPAADVGIGATFMAVLALLACIMSTMTEKELAELSSDPYLD